MRTPVFPGDPRTSRAKLSSVTALRWIVVPAGIFASSAQQEAVQAGRERGHAWSRQRALAIVQTLHNSRAVILGVDRSIDVRTGPEALEPLQNELARRL
jgi:hypothetical protein